MEDSAVEEAGHREDAADDGADLREEGGEGLALLAHDDLHRRDVVREDRARQAVAVLVVVVVDRVLEGLDGLPARDLVRGVDDLKVVLEGGVGAERVVVGAREAVVAELDLARQ